MTVKKGYEFGINRGLCIGRLVRGERDWISMVCVYLLGPVLLTEAIVFGEMSDER